jgi:excisionase family DNA binding protein
VAPQPARHYVSLNVASEYLGVSVKTVRRMIAAGEITGYRFGKRLLRVDLVEVESALRPIPTAGSAA